MRESLMCPSRARSPYEADDVTELQDSVLMLLEDAGIPTDVNDQVVALIAQAERELAGEHELDDDAGQAVIVMTEAARAPGAAFVKPSLNAALDCFFGAPQYRDAYEAEGMTRAEAHARFAVDGQVMFYNADGEKTVISRDLGRN